VKKRRVIRSDVAGYFIRRLIAVLVLCLGVIAHAQDFPSRPLKIVVTYPPGGGTDITARIVAKRLSERLGQPVIVENKAGAGGSIGMAAVASSPPDGYTLVLGNPGPNAINPAIYAKLGYDGEKDFAPITVLTVMPLLLCVDVSSPVKTVADLIALGRGGEPVQFGSSGNGSVSHLAGEMFNMMAGTKFVHIPYKGASPLTTAALSGEVQLSLLAAPDAVRQIKADKLRAIASTSSTRSPLLPEVATLAESGLAGFHIEIWYGLLAPASTPRAIVGRLHKELQAILGEPVIRERLMALSQLPSSTSPDEFLDLIRSDAAKYARLVKATGARID